MTEQTTDFKIILIGSIVLILGAVFIYSLISVPQPKQTTEINKPNYFASLDGKQLIFESSMKDNLQATSPSKTEVTVYQNSYLGYVRKTFTLNLKSGINYISIPKISSYTDIDSVKISDETDPNAILLGQTYVSGSKVTEYELLEQSIGKTITVKKDTQSTTGKLLATSPILLETAEGILSIYDYDIIIFPTGISAENVESSIVVALETNSPGNHEVTIAYLTSGLNWQANYQLSMAENTSDILSLASIRNSEDVDYENVSLRLVAGEISKNNYYNYPVPYAAAESKAGSASPNVRDIQSTNLFEFKAYDIPTLITLNKASSQQIPLLGRNEVDSTKIYTFSSSSYSNKIQTQLIIENKAENQLGVALPGGDVKLYAKFEGKDAYIGETTLPNTAADENMTLDAGVAFDLSGKETRTEHVELDKCTTSDTYNVVLKNHKTIPVLIKVSRYIYEDTKITAENYKHTDKSVNEVEWEIPISANSTSTLTFTTKTTDTYCQRYPF